MLIWHLLLAAGVPSAIVSLGIWFLQRKIVQGHNKIESREQARQENELLTLKSINAAIALGEATAIALKNGHANGETEKALAYAQKVKHEQKDFLTRLSIKNIYGDSE